MINLGTPTLIGLPYDASSSYQRGPADAPPVIREALWSPSANSWTELGVDIGEEGAVADVGDLALANCSPADARLAIEAAIARLMDGGARPVALGGDHSVTYPVLRAVRGHVPRLTIVHVDAHADLYDAFEGDRYSHACPFARIMEEQLADRLIQVGIRTMNAHQRAQAERFGVEVIEMRRIPRETRDLRFAIDGPVYLSVDIDALDPAFAPGVSHREPGGLSVRQLLDVIQSAGSLGGPIAGADVVELNPRNDPSGISAMAAAKIVRELLGLMLSRRE
ncbi:MAG TPA: agmatinase [Gemmatimonadaceae bacterium]|jgi:agmatinase|nr:agmatinase [Gemmatimonadaceae bacterium]